MSARLVVIAAAMIAAGTAVAAEPPRDPKAAAPQPSRPAQLMLASADQVPTPLAPDQANPQPPKRPRAARVTTCRCGDQAAEQPEQ